MTQGVDGKGKIGSVLQREDMIAILDTLPEVPHGPFIARLRKYSIIG